MKNKSNLVLLGFVVVALGAFVFLYVKFPKVEISSQPASVSNVAGESLSDDELKKQIGQMLMIGFRGTDIKEGSEIYNVLKDVKVGGVVLFDYDAPTKTYGRNIVGYNQTKDLISGLQKNAQSPLFVAVDAEGGNVNRLKEKYGFLPVVSAEKMGADKSLKTTDAESKKLANELSAVGFNMDLAPVVDVNVNPKNPIIGALGRSFSADAQTVVDNAEVFIKNLLGKNIIPVEKHFPGHGSSTTDSHLGMVDVTNTYKDQEFVPYQKLNKDGLLGVVMAAHIINKNIDKDYPASLSPNFLQNILRNQIGFNGVIMSDDMQMGAVVKNYTFDQALINAINAGCDILSLTNNGQQAYDSQMPYKARDIIFNAVKDGKIKEKTITDSYNRIIELKKKFGIDKNI